MSRIPIPPTTPMVEHHHPDSLSGPLDPALALDAVRECAVEMLLASVELHSAAIVGDVEVVEGGLWKIRCALQCAARTWREAYPRKGDIH